jgi:hypothetical protein
MLAAARAHLAPGGRFVAFKNVFIPNQNPIAKWIIKKDRGAFVRTEKAYREVCSRHFGSVRTTVLHDMLRVPYTHITLECAN